MAIKLIVTDIDGTLLNQNREVTPRTAEAIRRARERGVIVTLATGRTQRTIRDFLQFVTPGAPVIVANGALIVRADTGDILFESCLEDSAVREIWERGLELDMALVAWKRTELFINRLDGPMRHYRTLSYASARVTALPETFLPGVNKMLWVNDEKSVAVALSELEIRPVPGASCFTSEPTYLEFAPFGVSKGSGLKLVAGQFGIPPEEILAVGDEMNDLPMLKYAGLGVAMANAVDSVKRAASFVTASNEEDGLAQAIERFVLV